MAEKEYTAKKVILKNNQGEYLIPYVEFPVATETSAGIVQPDNSTITIENGLVSTGKNVYTKESLVAGAGLGLIEASDGGIDENTIACWHFENTLSDSVNNISFYAGEQFDSEYSKEGFGSSLSWMYNGSTTVTDFAPGTGDYTLDLQLLRRDSIAYFELYIKQYSLYFSGTSVYVYDRTTGNGLSNTYTIEVGNWYHIAIQRKDGLVQFFLNGIKIYEIEQKDNINIFFINCSTNQAGYIRLDEVRVSNIARYISPFNPPTKPYTDIISSANTLKVLTDNQTLTVNDGVLSAEGIKTKNAVLKYDWIGTKAEWEAGRENGTILDEWVCYITDDFVQTDTSGTRNYNELENKPTIGGIELKGNKELGELGIQSKLTAGANITISEDGTISATVTENGSVEIPSNMVTTDTEQTITSLKHFQGGIDLPINSEFMVANGTTVFKHNGSRLLMGATTDLLTIRSISTPKINRDGIDYENIDSGNISEFVNTNTGSNYELPTASTTTLGGVKVDGTTITIDENGVISSTATSSGESSGGNITGVYTEENLVAGEGIEIRDESSSGGIDEDTLLCLHFDNNTNDSSTYANSLNNSSLTLEYSQTAKFGDASCYSISGTVTNNVFTSVSDALTIDFWVNKNINENIAGTQISLGTNGGFDFAAYGSGSQSQFYVSINNDYIYWPFSYDSSLLNDGWNHLAGVFSKNEEGYIVARLFVNGHKVLEEATPNTTFYPEGEDMSQINFITGGGFDEFRISKKAVWTEDFTPNSSQYSADSGEQKKSINVDISNVNLSGSNVNVTYTHDLEETTTDLNSFASSVDADLSNLTELVDNAITPETIGNYLPTNVVTGTGITQIVRLTKTEYDALTTKNENTFYVIVGE